MTVAVVYATTSTARLALLEAVEEAKRRQADLAVLHVAGSPDAQLTAYRTGISEEIGKVIAATDGVEWTLHLRHAASDVEVNDALVALIEDIRADVVVVGARRRSP